MKTIFIISFITFILTIFYTIYSFSNKSLKLKSSNVTQNSGPTKELIQNIFQRLQATKYDGNNDAFGFIYQKGLYSSDIKLNVVTDNDLYNLFGTTAALPDNNMFVTNFVTYALIQSKNLGTIDFTEDYLQDSIDALLSFRNKKTKEGIPMYVFWPQTLIDGEWVCQPENMWVARDLLASLPKLVQYYIKKLFGISVDFIDGYAPAFRIPPDNDDTGINLVLGSLLNLNKEQYPNLADQWDDANENYVQLYKDIKKYTYKPFADDSNLNSIDPRTYFYMQGYFNKTMEESSQTGLKPEVTLFNTWITNIADQDYGYSQMPFSINNIDVTVNANALYGLATFLLTNRNIQQVLEIYDQEVSQLILDVTDFLVWAIESEIILERPDLALTYYPSIFDFYWFIARTHQFLEGYDNIQFPELEICKQKFNKVINEHVYQQIQDQMLTDENGNIYWESFLGNYYEDKKLHTDRAFTTTMALNALIDIFTIPTQDNKLKYRNSAPQKAKDIIENSINYLSQLMDNDSTPLGNTFFSGSVKTWEDYPYWYPSNSNYYLDWELGWTFHVDPSKPKEEDSKDRYNYQKKFDEINKQSKDTITYICAVEGYIPATEYQYQVYNFQWWGVDTPVDFGGFNQKGAVFPYWTSDSITLAYSMLAFSKYISIE